MKYTYVWHDGVVVRLANWYSQAEIWSGGKWIPFPESDGGDIRYSQEVAMSTGTPLSEEEALAKIGELA
jgi:hypothetical protein